MRVKLNRRKSTVDSMLAWIAILFLGFAIATVNAEESESPELEETTVDNSSEEESVDATEDEESDTESTAEESAEGEESGPMEQMVVTGSRLPEGDPAALVHSYSEQEIIATGASNLEEFFRTLPWQFSSLSSQTSYIFNTGDDYPGAYAMDLATVNLRSLGSANTLVLLNGRRVAGYAGQEEDFANIMGIPIDAIERVEIQLDGGSAVYGADAIAGVVNFITKKNYRGLTANFRQEASATGADTMSIGGTGGLHWPSGSTTVTLSMNEREPIINAKTGWTTRDYRPMLGPEFDYRIYTYGQPGVVRDWNGNLRYPGYDWLNPKTYQLPDDHSGVGATVEDFKVDDVSPYDRIRLENGAHSEYQSITISAEQRFFQDTLEIFTDIIHSESESYQRNELTYGSILVPASNAYNPFGKHMHVSYIPSYEYDNGLLKTPYNESINTQRTATFGYRWRFRVEQQLEMNYTDSRSIRDATSYRINYQRHQSDPSAARFYEALKSSDPAVALNFFGNGTVQGEAFEELLTQTFGPYRYRSKTISYNVLMSGRLFDLWGGKITYSLGASRRGTTIYYTGQYSFGWEGTRRFDGTGNSIGVSQPTQRSAAYFGELAIPIIDRENQGWWAKSLYLTVQNRYDVNWLWGSAGGTSLTDYPPYSEWPTDELDVWDPDTGEYITITVVNFPGRTFNPNIVKTEQSKQSPRVGLRYKPIEDLTIRFSWSRAFQLPLPRDLFSTYDDLEYTYEIFDPYDPDGPTRTRVPYTYQFYNQDLEPEFSDTKSLSLNWQPEFLDGFILDLDYSTVDFQNRVETSNSLIFDHPEIAFKVPGIIDRNERGDAIHIYFKPINLAEKRNTIFEARVRYRFGIGNLGLFEPQIRYTRTLEDFKRITDDTPPITALGTQETGDRYRTTLSLYWDRSNMRGNLFVYYKPGYLNHEAHYCQFRQVGVGRCTAYWDYISIQVGSLTTVDGTFTYRFENDLELQVGGRNILNRDAPNTIRGGIPYDPTRWDARGRVLSLSLRYSM